MGLSYMKCAVPGCERARDLERSYCPDHEMLRCSEEASVGTLEGKSYYKTQPAQKGQKPAEQRGALSEQPADRMTDEKEIISHAYDQAQTMWRESNQRLITENLQLEAELTRLGACIQKVK